mmetsp:Transcript_59871/g.110869  ORF Transcript_59871/g.110869 Transcript_59871/m.110869 type:complete len:271 (-) Transcript_59871:643-1455(-)
MLETSRSSQCAKDNSAIEPGCLLNALHKRCTPASPRRHHSIPSFVIFDGGACTLSTKASKESKSHVEGSKNWKSSINSSRLGALLMKLDIARTVCPGVTAGRFSRTNLRSLGYAASTKPCKSSGATSTKCRTSVHAKPAGALSPNVGRPEKEDEDELEDPPDDEESELGLSGTAARAAFALKRDTNTGPSRCCNPFRQEVDRSSASLAACWSEASSRLSKRCSRGRHLDCRSTIFRKEWQGPCTSPSRSQKASESRGKWNWTVTSAPKDT